MKKPFRVQATLLVVAVLTAFLFYQCPLDILTPELSPEDYSAQIKVTSSEQNSVESNSGAGIFIPEGAVPPTDAGEDGTMIFSVEKDSSTVFTPPIGVGVESDVYKFGPSGFVFAQPVKISIPYTGDVAPENLRMYRINPTTGASEAFPAEVDTENKTLSTYTYEFSPWYIGRGNFESTAYGLIEFHNTLSSMATISVTSCTLKYPDSDTNFNQNTAQISVGYAGQIGWEDDMKWFLPQGDYTVCIEYGTTREYSSSDRHNYSFSFSLGKAAISNYGNFTPEKEHLITSIGTAGMCGTAPEYTTSVGTGDVQITLSWYSASAIDLDLWVTDPEGGMCYYGNDNTSSGGHLDRDNLCSNYINGRPENIYWNDPTSGNYLIQVNWYSGCSGSVSSIPYSVRVVTENNVKTFNGTINSNETVDVASMGFNSSLSMVNFLKSGRVFQYQGELPAKE